MENVKLKSLDYLFLSLSMISVIWSQYLMPSYSRATITESSDGFTIELDLMRYEM